MGAESILMMMGAGMNAIGSFYAAKSQKYSLRSQAMESDFAQGMANMSARAAESQSQSILAAAQQQKGRYTLQAGATKAAAKSSLAARGIQAGVGSAAEEVASIDLAKEMDLLTIDQNVAQAVAGARMQRVNYQNQAMMAGVSASNIRATAKGIRPWMSAATSLLGSSSQVAGQMAQDRRWSAWESANRG